MLSDIKYSMSSVKWRALATKLLDRCQRSLSPLHQFALASNIWIPVPLKTNSCKYFRSSYFLFQVSNLDDCLHVTDSFSQSRM